MPAPAIYKIAVGSTLLPLGVTCKRPDGSVIDLTGKTVKFYATNPAGTVVIEETETGVTVSDADAGECQYDFRSADVAAKATLYCYFTIYDGAEFERVPIEDGALVTHVV